VSWKQDGTVRAFDLVRYRNFRIFTTPRPVQFTCLAVDPSGEVRPKNNPELEPQNPAKRIASQLLLHELEGRWTC